MNRHKLIQSIPAAKSKMLSDKLINFILTSKSDEKMPIRLANSILHHWQHDTLTTENGLTVLLEAAFLLEPDKTIEALNELQLTSVAEKLKEISTKI